MSDWITIGTIIAPHGVRGDVRIYPQTDFPERFLQMESCYIGGKEYHIRSAKFHKQFVLLSFEEIPDRTAAESLGKQDIQVREDELVPLPEGRYYIYQIIGLAVYDTEGNHLGEVSDVLQPGANDVYVVSKEGAKDELIPALNGVVLTIDLDAKKMIVDPPEWI